MYFKVGLKGLFNTKRLSNVYQRKNYNHKEYDGVNNGFHIPVHRLVHIVLKKPSALQRSHWRHAVLNHWQLQYLFHRLFRCTSDKTPHMQVTDPWLQESTGRFPSHKASNVDYVSMPWRHHDTKVGVTIRQYHSKFGCCTHVPYWPS